jgi:hypothetical protein
MNMAELILFEKASFEGRQRKITRSQPSLDDFNAITSSINVHDGHWQFFSSTNYQGLLGSLQHGAYPWVKAAGLPNDAIRSVKLIG